MTENEHKQIDALPEVQNPLELFEALEKDVEKLQSQLRSLEKSTPKTKFLRKAIGKRSKASTDNVEQLEVCGARLAAKSSLRGGGHLVEQLQDNPFDSKARLALVEMFLRKAEGASLLLQRDAFLLAMLEVEGSELSTDSLQTALLAQKQYLEALFAVLKQKGEDAVRGGGKESADAKGGDDSEQKLELYRISRQKWFVQELLKLLKYRTLDSNRSIPLEQMSQSAKARKEDLASPFPAMLEAAAGLPLARTVRQRMLTVLEKIAKKVPIGGYYESLLYRKRATQLMLAYVAGNSEVVDSIKRLLKNASDSILQTVKMLHGHTHPHEQAVGLREYALVNLTIYQYLPQMGVALGAEHLQHMENATQLLSKIMGEKGVPELQKKLLRSIHEIRGDGKKAGSSGGKKTATRTEEETKTESKNLAKKNPKKIPDDAPRKSRKGFFEGEVPNEMEVYANKPVKKGRPDFFGRDISKEE